MDFEQRQAYEADYRGRGFRMEDVPLSKIIWGFTEPRIYRNLTRIDESQLPELLKNQFGEYTIKDGRHRIFLAAQRIRGDPRKAFIRAWVVDVHAGRDIIEEKETASLIERFIEVLEKDLQKLLPKDIKDKLEQVKYDLIGKEKRDIGMLEVLHHQLEIIKAGKVPSSEELTKLRKLIDREQRFYKSSQIRW